MKNSNSWKNNVSEYDKIEETVINLFFSQLESLSLDSFFWKSPYFKATYRDGTKIMDANPIFSAINQKENLIIKVTIDDSYKKFNIINSYFDKRKLINIFIDIKHLDKLEVIFRTILLIEIID